MAGKIGFLLGLGTGYVLGARSGRQAYDRMVAKAREVWSDPRVQHKADQAQDMVKEKAGQAGDVLMEKAQHAGSAVADKVGNKDSQESSTQPPSGSSWPSSVDRPGTTGGL